LFRRARPGAAYLAGAPLLIAHRGGGALAPENTLLAFRRAIDWWRADILEMDVQPTRDGEAVVFHDATLDRTTDGSGPIAGHTLAELREIDAGFRFSGAGGTYPFRGAGVGLSTLEEVLVECPDVRVNVEIKDARAAEAVGEAVRRTRSEHRILVAAGEGASRGGLRSGSWPISASEEELRAFYAAHRMRATRFFVPAVDALQLPEIHEDRRIVTERLVADAHAANLAVHVWTVDAEADMRRLLAWGVDGIVTDRPDVLARVLRDTHGRPAAPGPPTGEI
jgi:glycerophosphoryl diester phosphodiesterase